jgi:hypothetical protein
MFILFAFSKGTINEKSKHSCKKVNEIYNYSNNVWNEKGAIFLKADKFVIYILQFFEYSHRDLRFADPEHPLRSSERNNNLFSGTGYSSSGSAFIQTKKNNCVQPALAWLLTGTVSTILSAVMIGYLPNLTNIILVS